MLYARVDEIVEVKRVFGVHWPAATNDEASQRAKGNFDQGPALKIKDWDGNGVADPTSYVMTYVLKGLDADGSGAPDCGSDGAATEAAVAWASSVGVRRLSIVGLTRGIIGRWEDLHRYVRDQQPHECPRARTIIRAMRKKQWATALALLGAFQDRAEAKRQPRLVGYHETRENHWQEQVKRRAGWLTQTACLTYIDLNAASARRFLELAPADVTTDDVVNLIRDAADNRKLLWQKIRGVELAQKFRQETPLPVEEKKADSGPRYDLFSDPRYQRTPNEPEDLHRQSTPDRAVSGAATFVCPTCGTTVLKAGRT